MFLSGHWVARRQRRVITRLIELDRRGIEIIEQVFDEQRLRVVKRNALEEVFVNSFGDVTREREQVMRQRSVGWTIRMQLYNTVPLLGAPIVRLVARASALSVAEAAAIAALLPQMLLAVTRLTDWYVGLAEVWPYVDRALRVLDEPLPQDTTDDTIQPDELAGQPLILTDVRCEMGDREVLSGIYLNAASGSYEVIMGPNGAGKTTLIDVITGLTPPQGDDSSVRIGTIPLARVPRTLRAGHIRVIDSTPTTFAGTARQNIALFHPGASEAEIRWACAIAQIDEVASFLDRPAQQLSTGYKERLDLAQAVLAKPEILILDEALAHLDAIARAGVHQALANQVPNTTKIEVTHRGAARSPVFTGILVIERGIVVEQGTHDQLIQLGGRYSQYVAASER
jgi:ATP-binding cassette subfamily B protein